MLAGIDSGQILTAVISGALLALVGKAITVSLKVNRQIRDHNLKADVLAKKLERWIYDRHLRLYDEVRILNLTGSEPLPPRAPGESPPIEKREQAWRLRSGQESLMIAALSEYRDFATERVREFKALAQEEGPFHARYRKLRRLEPVDLRLPRDRREDIASWRQRREFASGRPVVTIKKTDDATARELDIEPLETEVGLTWSDAAKRTTVTQ